MKLVFPNTQELIYNYVNGKLNSIIDPAGRETSFSYDQELLTEVEFPDSTSRGFDYDINGRIIHDKNQENQKTEISYSEYGRVIGVKNPDNTTKKISDLTTQTLANAYVSGTTGSLVPIGFEGNQVSTIITDENNNSTQIIKDLYGYVAKVKDAAGRITSFKRNIFGQPTIITRPDGSKIEYTYAENSTDLLSIKDLSTGIMVST